MPTLRLRAAGSPLHAYLAGFPIAFLTLAFLLDLAALASGDPLWIRAARLELGLGLVLGAAAALAGLLDFMALKLEGRARLICWLHLLTGVAVLGLAAAAWLAHRGQPDAAQLSVLTGLTVALLLAQGWLGGELVFGHGANVGRR